MTAFPKETIARMRQFYASGKHPQEDIAELLGVSRTSVIRHVKGILGGMKRPDRGKYALRGNEDRFVNAENRNSGIPDYLI